MIFYKKITICNLFAYYETQSVNFTQEDGKPVYLLFGENGFGKTSFIRSVKLLFAGSGLLSDNASVPSVILDIVNNKGRGSFTPKQLLLGKGDDWRGVFNSNAVRANQNNFFVEILLDDNGKEIRIRREWSRYPELKERLTYQKESEILHDNQAKDEIEQILPLNFLQFFVFDGEEIVNMADEMSAELKDKIQSILNISVLDRIIKQLNNKERNLITQSNIASSEKSRLIHLQGELGSAKEELENTNFNIDLLRKDIKQNSEILLEKSNQRDLNIKNSSKEHERLILLKQQANDDLDRFKKEISEYGGEILFLGVDEIYAEIFSELEKSISQNAFNKDDLTKLANFSTEILHHKLALKCDKYDLNDAIKEAFLEFIKNDSKIFKGINKDATINQYQSACNGALKLIQALKNAKEARTQIKEAMDNLNNYNADTAHQERINQLSQEIEALEQEKLSLNENLKQKSQLKIELENKISNCEIEITDLKDKVWRDERVKKELEILLKTKEQINNYKQGRIQRTSKRLKNEVLKNYKSLLPNDNVADVRIENFAVKLVNLDGEIIAIANQSAGQKQIAAISIFWALSRLSDKKLPLIIDTPIGRLDAINRKNLIQKYYTDASNQVIVLPTSTEFGQRELSFMDNKIAGVYEITNQESTRSHAKIVKKD
ncbi:hypothetical protein [Campylobacter gastrosuis]|uniref:DNA sulfur modification protein DndD n=1 Tax=Campylobacter gastrosuis TaxID=2974576 RepID=A0ABT7HRV9_9BACT|nr:hypothetical protein [Campylobacter gastrosuis]MDL0089574.1 hypothetical protein [Campylobacter gastrosuis]